jgi:hypothetical protein
MRPPERYHSWRVSWQTVNLHVWHWPVPPPRLVPAASGATFATSKVVTFNAVTSRRVRSMLAPGEGRWFSRGQLPREAHYGGLCDCPQIVVACSRARNVDRLPGRSLDPIFRPH